MAGEHGSGNRAIWIVAFALLIILGIWLSTFFIDWRVWLRRLDEWIASFGPWAPVVFVLSYVLLRSLSITGAPLTFLAAGLFGAVKGMILLSLSATLTAAICFLIARYLARNSVVKWLTLHPKWRRLDDLTQERGAIVVAITRLLNIFPFALLNYGFGLTSVRFWTYLFWSWLCMLPALFVFVTGGNALRGFLESGRFPWLLAVAWVGALMTMGILVLIAARWWRRSNRLNSQYQGEQNEKESSKS